QDNKRKPGPRECFRDTVTERALNLERHIFIYVSLGYMSYPHSVGLHEPRSLILILHTEPTKPYARLLPRSRAITLNGAANDPSPTFFICYSERVTHSETLFVTPCAK